MGPFIIGNYIVSGICLALALMHMAVYFRQTERKTDLFFAIMAVCVAFSTFYETTMHQAVTVSAYTTALKKALSFQGILWIAFAWFVNAYTGNPRRNLIFAVTGLYFLAVFINESHRTAFSTQKLKI